MSDNWKYDGLSTTFDETWVRLLHCFSFLAVIIVLIHQHLQEPSVSIPKGTIMEALKVLIGMGCDLTIFKKLSVLI